MKRVAVSALLLAGACAALAEESSKMSAKEQQAMEAYQQFGAPGPEHRKLETMVGTWDMRVKIWMSPAGPPSETKGVSENRMILGGRWLEQRFTVQDDSQARSTLAYWVNAGGRNEMHVLNLKENEPMQQPFEGMGYTGYDNSKKQYVSWWMDTASTAGTMTTGSTAPDGKSLTLAGSTDDPASGATSQVKEIITVLDADHHNFEMWMTDASGNSSKTMAIAYTRRK